jgi:hypothetical protein
MIRRTILPVGTHLLATSILVATAALAVAQTPGSGQAAGRLAVDGKPISFAYAYAHVAPNSESQDLLWVLLTEKAVAGDPARAMTSPDLEAPHSCV